MTEPPPTHETVYILIGCLGETCAHYGEPIITELWVDHSPIDNRRLAQPYTWRQVSPQCARTPEYAARRQRIYDQARDAVAAVYKSGLTAREANRKAARAWDEITAEYKGQPCPFYEPTDPQETNQCPT